MKQKDISLLILIVGISAIVAYFISSTFITNPKNRQTKVEVVETISPAFPGVGELNTKYFNSNSVDPTQTIQIGNSSNNQPFNNKQ